VGQHEGAAAIGGQSRAGEAPASSSLPLAPQQQQQQQLQRQLSKPQLEEVGIQSKGPSSQSQHAASVGMKNNEPGASPQAGVVGAAEVQVMTHMTHVI
jgi:hypothetical protein